MLLAAGFETASQLSALILAGQTNAWLLGAFFSCGMLLVDRLDGYLAASTQKLAAIGHVNANAASRLLGSKRKSLPVIAASWTHIVRNGDRNSSLGALFLSIPRSTPTLIADLQRFRRKRVSYLCRILVNCPLFRDAMAPPTWRLVPQACHAACAGRHRPRLPCEPEERRDRSNLST